MSSELPAEVEGLIALLPSWTATGPDGVARGNCIEIVKLATTVWRRLGVESKPLACEVAVANEWVSEVSDPRARVIRVACEARRGVEAGTDLLSVQEPARRGAFAGHLVAAGAAWFADLSAPQFHHPEWGIHLDGAVGGPYDPAEPEVQFAVGGATLAYRWHPEIRSFRTTPAWRQDLGRDLVEYLVERVRKHMEAH